MREELLKIAASALRKRIQVVLSRMTPPGTADDPGQGFAYFSMRLGGKRIGKAEVALPMEGTPWIRSTSIDPAYHGMGLGKKLYGEMLRRVPGGVLNSDNNVTNEAVRVWNSMAKSRDKAGNKVYGDIALAADAVPGAAADIGTFTGFRAGLCAWPSVFTGARLPEKAKIAMLQKVSSTRVMRELAKRIAAAGGAKAVAKNPSLVPMIDDLQRASRSGQIDQLADRQLTYLGRGSDGRASTTLGLKHPGLEVRKVPLTNPEGTRSNLSGKHPAIQDMLVRRNVAENMVLQREARGHEMVQRAYDSDPKLQKLVNIPQYRGIEYSTGNKLGNTRQQLMDVGEGGLAGLPLRNAIARTKPVSEASYRLANKHKLMHIDTHQGNVKYMDSAGKPLDKPVMFDFGRVQQVTKPITEAEIGHMAGTPFFTPKTGATPNMFGVHGSTRDTGEMQAAAGMALDKFRKGKQYVPTPPLMTPAYANAATVVQPRAR